MEASYKELSEKYQRALADAKTFGIDLTSKEFDNLLKGRLFEIFIVKRFKDVPNLELLEWTPDKGFEHEVPVKSNGNPDLVYRWKNQYEFAIECKYRTEPEDIFKENLGPAIDWANVSQIRRYTKFGEERNIPVWIGIGVSGPPDSPDHIYLCEITQLLNTSLRLNQRRSKHETRACSMPKLKTLSLKEEILRQDATLLLENLQRPLPPIAQESPPHRGDKVAYPSY